MRYPLWLDPFGANSQAHTPAYKLAAFERAIENYREVQQQHADFIEFMEREGTAASAEADHERAEVLLRQVETARDVLAGQALVVLADGLLERCAEILAIETAGRP